MDAYVAAGPGAVEALPAGLVIVRWVACEAVEERWLGALDAAERARAERFHFAADRASYVAAHALARGMLARYGGVHQARFVTGRFGKPLLAPGCSGAAADRPWPQHPHPGPLPAREGEGVCFNLSHTRGMAACAVARGMAVGVDVEALDRRAGEGIAARFFPPAEAALVAAAPEAGRRAVFMRLWTLKEAVMKATGRGFDLPLDAFTVTLDPLGVRFHAGPATAWSLQQAMAGAGHVVAAATEGVARFDLRAADPGEMGEWGCIG